MATVKFSINDEYYDKLKVAAENKGMTIQDYIRYKLFDIDTIFTVEEAIRRVQTGDFKTFSLPDLYGDEWKTISRPLAGVFGKNFYKYICNHPELEIYSLGYNKSIHREMYTYKL